MYFYFTIQFPKFTTQDSYRNKTKYTLKEIMFIKKKHTFICNITPYI